MRESVVMSWINSHIAKTEKKVLAVLDDFEKRGQPNPTMVDIYTRGKEMRRERRSEGWRMKMPIAFALYYLERRGDIIVTHTEDSAYRYRRNT